MSRIIQDIITLAGGLDKLRRLDVQPTGRPVLAIEKTEQGCVAVTFGNAFTANFTVTNNKHGKRKLCCPAWSKPLDTMLRRQGYVEAAMHFHLTTS